MVQKHGGQILLTSGRKYKRLAFQQTNYITLWPLKTLAAVLNTRFLCVFRAKRDFSIRNAAHSLQGWWKSSDKKTYNKDNVICSISSSPGGKLTDIEWQDIYMKLQWGTLVKPNMFTATNPKTTSTVYQNERTHAY